MIVLQILGIFLSVIAALILLLLLFMLLRVKLMLSYTENGEIKFLVKILCFTFGNKKKKPKAEKPKKEKKPSKLVAKIKKKFGLDIIDSEELKKNVGEKGISETVNKIATLVTLIAGQVVWLLKKFRIDKLRILAVCSGGDAADAAMDYGLVCATLYPLAGYLTSHLNMADNAEDIQIGCDFDGNSHFEFDLFVSVRIIYIVRAVIRNLSNVAASGIYEEAKQ